MSDGVLIAMIASLTAVVTSTLTLIATLVNGRKHDQQAIKIAEIHLDTNGRLTKLASANELLTAEIHALREHKK